MTLKALVGLSDGNKILKADVIEHEGRLWLVPEWIEAPTEGWRAPTRIIRVDMPFQWIEGGQPANLLLPDPMPKSLFDCRTPPPADTPYTVVDLPAGIRLPMPDRRLS